ncbi:hypothetical protein D3C85_1038940 [compost metagenome]
MLLFVFHTEGDVATGNEVVQRFEGVGRHLVVVIELLVPFGDAPELATAVVVIDQCHLPAVFVDVHVALGIDMPFARLDRGDHFPDPVQLIAGQVLVDVPGLDHIVVLELWRIELVAVVGNVHFLLADQLPVITIRRTGKHVEVIGGTQAIGRCSRAVIGHLRCTPHPTLAGVVDPGQARLLHLIEGFMHQQYVAGQARGRSHGLLEEQQHVGTFVGGQVRRFLGYRHFFLEADAGE